jgi:hypothetical protein
VQKPDPQKNSTVNITAAQVEKQPPKNVTTNSTSVAQAPANKTSNSTTVVQKKKAGKDDDQNDKEQVQLDSLFLTIEEELV